MSQQAALEHMESIIYDPQQLFSNEINGVQEGVSEEATKGTAPTEVKVGDDKGEDKS